MDRWVAARHNSVPADESGTEEPVSIWALKTASLHELSGTCPSQSLTLILESVRRMGNARQGASGNTASVS
jgi:hypothetical protein